LRNVRKRSNCDEIYSKGEKRFVSICDEFEELEFTWRIVYLCVGIAHPDYPELELQNAFKCRTLQTRGEPR